jgi:hypothetical protein
MPAFQQHGRARFILRVGTHSSRSSERRNRHTRRFPLPKGCAGISPWRASSNTRRRRNDRNSAAFSSVHQGLGRSPFTYWRHAARFFRIQFQPSPSRNRMPGSLRDPPQSENDAGSDLTRIQFAACVNCGKSSTGCAAHFLHTCCTPLAHPCTLYFWWVQSGEI